MLKIFLRAITMPTAMVAIILLGTFVDNFIGNAMARASEPVNDVVYVRIKPSNQSNTKDVSKEAMTDAPISTKVFRGGR